VPIFLLLLALHAIPVALAVQLQPARIFWLLDFLAIAYVVWAMAEGAASIPGARGSPQPRSSCSRPPAAGT
jgi:hypothetical protein